MIDLTIKTLESANHHFSVEDETTVAQLKELIRDEMGIEINQQRLIFCGKVLTDEKRLADCDVNGKVIHLVPRPPPSPQSRATNQTQRRRMRDALEDAHRVIDRLANQPTTNRPAREVPLPPAGQPAEPERPHSVMPVANRLDFIRRAIEDIRQSLSALSFIINGDSTTAATAPEPDASAFASASALDEAAAAPEPSGSASDKPPADNTASGEAAVVPEAMDVEDEQPMATGFHTPDFLEPMAEGPNTPDTSSSSHHSVYSPGEDSNSPPFRHPSPGREFDREMPLLTGPRDLAALVEELDQLREDFAPYRAIYLDILRDTNNSQLNQDEVNRRQTVVELVSDVIHSFAHAFHAISDLDIAIGQHITRLTTGFTHRTVQTQVNVVHATRLPPETVTLNRGTGGGSGSRQTGGGTPLIAAALRRANNIRANAPQGNSETNRNQAQTAAAPDSFTYQVEARMPIRIPVDTTFINDLAASLQNVQHVFPGQSGQSAQNSQNQAQGENSGQNQGVNQNQPEGTTGGAANQTQGQNTAQPRPRGRMIMEIENLVRSLTQAHPDMDVVMSMEEIHPIGPPFGTSQEWTVPGPTNNSEGLGPDRDPLRANFVPFSFSVNNPPANGQESAQNGASGNANAANGSANASTENNGAFSGIRFAAPGFGDAPRFGMPGFPNPFSIGGDAVPSFSQGLGVTTYGPATVTLQPDGEMVMTPLSPENTDTDNDMLQSMLNTFFRSSGTQNDSNIDTANANSNSTQFMTPPTSSSNSSSSNTEPTTTTSAATGTSAGQPFTVHSHITYSLSPDMLARAPVNDSWGLNLNVAVPGQEIPQLIFVENRGAAGTPSTGATRRTTGGDRRRNNNAQRRNRFRQTRTESPIASRSNQRVRGWMAYDSSLKCDSIHARQRLIERRALHNEQMRERRSRPTPTNIYRLEQRNYNFSTRHMACMMRLLSGPISIEGRLNAFMVTVARVLYLDRFQCRQHPLMNMPREFLFIRMQLRDYMNRVMLSARQTAGSVDTLDRVTSVILRRHQGFLARLSNYTTIDENMDAVAMIREWIRERIPAIIACIMSEANSDVFVAQFYAIFGRFYTDLCALGMRFCANGFEEFRVLYTAFIDDVTANFEETAQEWVRLLSRENLLGIQDTIDHVAYMQTYGVQTPRHRVTPSTTTPQPPLARNDTPDTLESLPSLSIPTMSPTSSGSGSPPAPEPDDDHSLSSLLSPGEESMIDTSSITSHNSVQRSPVQSTATSPRHDTVAPTAGQSQTSQEGQINTNTQPTDSQTSQAGHSGTKRHISSMEEPSHSAQTDKENKPVQGICPSFIKASPCQDEASHSGQSEASHSRQSSIEIGNLPISESHRTKSLPQSLGVQSAESISGLNMQGAQSEPALSGPQQNDNNSNDESTNLAMPQVATTTATNTTEQPTLQSMRLHWDEQWMPVFTRDQRIQRERERPQEPYSDAYLYGMPSSKRRCIRASRPPTNLDGFLNESVREATDSAPSVEATQMRSRLLDSSVRSRLIDSMRSIVRTRAETSEDYDPVRFSATARFIDQKKAPKRPKKETDSDQEPEKME